MKNQTLSRKRRLIKAKKWLEELENRNYIVSKYKKHFHVDSICAIKELEMLGVQFDENTVNSIIKSEEKKIERKRLKNLEDSNNDCDEFFLFIAGYTSNGFAYGITWEEWDELNKEFE